MSLDQNPFRILGATPRDTKERLAELADEQVLLGSDEALDARAALLNPRKRLSAEITWLPGVSPRRAQESLQAIAARRLPGVSGFPPLARANLLAHYLDGLTRPSRADLYGQIVQLARAADEIRVDETVRTINEEREVARFAQIQDPSLVEVELRDLFNDYVRVCTRRLDELPTDTMIGLYSSLIGDLSNGGTERAPKLIYSLLDHYELKTGEYLSTESARIQQLADSVEAEADRKVPQAQVRAKLNEVVAALRAWDHIAQPIQLSSMSRGVAHDESRDLASHIRNFAVHLYNEHEYLDEAKFLSEQLSELFAEVASIADQVDEDLRILNQNKKARDNAEARSKEEASSFAREISYETSVGRILKDKLKLSPAGFDFKGRITPLEHIWGTSWGAVRHSTNGIPTGTSYHIRLFSGQEVRELEPNQQQYQELTQRLWKAVCVRILFDMIGIWKSGKPVYIGGVQILDSGLHLTKTSFFKGSETRFFKWSELQKSTHDGALHFFARTDKKFSASFSYKDTANVHILDFAADRIWEGKAAVLSKILGN